MHQPLIYLTLTYVCGIALAKVLPLPFFLICSFILVTFVFTLIFARSKITYFIIILVFLLGIASHQYRLIVPSNDVSRFIGKEANLIGIICNEPDEKENCTLFTLKAKKIEINNVLRKAGGKVNVLTNSKIKLSYGDEIKIKGWLSEFTELANPGLTSFSDQLEIKGIRCQLSSKNSDPQILSKGHVNPLVLLGNYLRDKFSSVIEKTLQKPYSTLLGSIILGSKVSPPPPDVSEAYKKTGVVHLLVASGMQLTILMGVSLSICKYFNVPFILSAILASFSVILYTLVAGAEASIVRALVMVELPLVAKLLDRDADIFISLSLSALIILIVNPLNLFNIGFQLTFAATWSLLYITPVLEEKLKIFLPGFLATIFAASIPPVLVTSPITIFYFSQFSIIAIIANILILPWAGFLLVLGFTSTALGLLFLPIAQALNSTAFLLIKLLNFIVFTFANFPFASTSISQPTLVLIFGYYAGLIALTEYIKGRLKFDKKYLGYFSLFLIALVVWNFALSQPNYSKDLIITMIDVGQGDSILVEAPSGKKMLIDGGGSSKVSDVDFVGAKVVVPFLKRKGVNKLDLLVLTHPHDDHVGGLNEVLKSIKTDCVLDPCLICSSETYTRFSRLINEKNIHFKLARAGETINLGGGVVGDIINPSMPLQKDTNSDLNNNSVVIRLIYGKSSILLVGDLEKEGEERALKSYKKLRSDVLKVGHHGSKGASSVEFLKRVSPEIGLISCGAKNKFGHPHKAALKRLMDKNIKILRTDKNGAITVRSNGSRFFIKSCR